MIFEIPKQTLLTSPRFSDMPEPPEMLRIKTANDSPEELFRKKRIIAVVGTRDITLEGMFVTGKIVRALRDENVVIVSGLAFGVDTLAHQTALECGMSTVGVIPTGFDCIYPAANKALADTMVSTHGRALVTEYPDGTEPIAMNFIQRNRIIAALADVVIVSETKEKGSAIVTAKLAMELGKKILAYYNPTGRTHNGSYYQLISGRIAEMLSPDMIDKLPELLS